MTSKPSMKFGVSLGQERVTWPEIEEAALLVEELGFDSLWSHDHLIPSDPGRNEGPCLEAWAILGAFARMTKNVTIGPMVAGNTYRNPVLLAKSATTVDIISGGRLIFGIGAGWFEMEHTAYDFPFYTVGERIRRLDEAVELIKKLWTSDGPVDFAGKYYNLRSAPFDPRPVQQPHPPILIAGGGEKRTLRVTAKWGDMMNINGHAQIAAHKYRVLEEHCRAVGRDPAEIVKTANGAFVPPEKMDDWNRWMDHLAETMPDQRKSRGEGGVVGDMDAIRDWVRGHVEVGTQQVIFTMRSPYPLESLRTFAKKVMPEFR